MLPTYPSDASLDIESPSYNGFSEKTESRPLIQVPRLTINESVNEWLSDVLPPPYSSEGDEDSDSSDTSGPRTVNHRLEATLLDPENTAWTSPYSVNQHRLRRSTVSHPGAELLEGENRAWASRSDAARSSLSTKAISNTHTSLLSPDREPHSIHPRHIPHPHLSLLFKPHNQSSSPFTGGSDPNQASRDALPRYKATMLEPDNSAWSSPPTSPLSAAFASITAAASRAAPSRRSRRRATISHSPAEMLNN